MVPPGDEITFFDVKALLRIDVMFARGIGAMGLCFAHKSQVPKKTLPLKRPRGAFLFRFFAPSPSPQAQPKGSGIITSVESKYDETQFLVFDRKFQVFG